MVQNIALQTTDFRTFTIFEHIFKNFFAGRFLLDARLRSRKKEERTRESSLESRGGGRGSTSYRASSSYFGAASPRGGGGTLKDGEEGKKSVDEKREKGGREGEQQLELKSFCLKGSSSSFLPRFSPPPLPIFFLSLFLPLSEISQAFLFFSSFSNSP